MIFWSICIGLILILCINHIHGKGFLIYLYTLYAVFFILLSCGILSLLVPIVQIGEEGIFFRGLIKRCTMKWENVKEVGIIDSYVYFKTTNIRMTSAMQIFWQEKISNELIAVQYQKEIPDIIKKYWPQPIKNLDKLNIL